MKINPKLKDELKKYLLKKQREEQEKITIIASHQLTNEELVLLEEYVPELKNTVPNVEIDSSLMAGIIIRKGSKILDLSLTGRIKKLKELIDEIS